MTHFCHLVLLTEKCVVLCMSFFFHKTLNARDINGEKKFKKKKTIKNKTIQ